MFFFKCFEHHKPLTSISFRESRYPIENPKCSNRRQITKWENLKNNSNAMYKPKSKRYKSEISQEIQKSETNGYNVGMGQEDTGQ